ncbi:HNH endonuclease [Rhodococcus sp. D2-41]|uniref:HNH endonuclease n=1 Tax=Speluncibacter jeojiensis TaxID=2710754 RepID=UPI00240EE996|nr:HNH endonuclease signature motif containing protein [Rhodococcus sp. D2-41]MDG3012470.1 HNH endonuclease [Rhodococcus sp. D2-41]
MAWAKNSNTRHVPHAVQRACFDRDEHRCRRCGYEGAGRGDLHADHAVPQHRGGTHHLDNLVTLCVPCHKLKTEAEQAASVKQRAARRRLPPTPHPGLKPPGE